MIATVVSVVVLTLGSLIDRFILPLIHIEGKLKATVRALGFRLMWLTHLEGVEAPRYRLRTEVHLNYIEMLHVLTSFLN